MRPEEYDALPSVEMTRAQWRGLPFIIPGLPGPALIWPMGAVAMNCPWGDLVGYYTILPRARAVNLFGAVYDAPDTMRRVVFGREQVPAWMAL